MNFLHPKPLKSIKEQQLSTIDIIQFYRYDCIPFQRYVYKDSKLFKLIIDTSISINSRINIGWDIQVKFVPIITKWNIKDLSVRNYLHSCKIGGLEGLGYLGRVFSRFYKVDKTSFLMSMSDIRKKCLEEASKYINKYYTVYNIYAIKEDIPLAIEYCNNNK